MFAPQNEKKYMSVSLIMMELELHHCQKLVEELKSDLVQKDFQLAKVIKDNQTYHQQILGLEKEKGEVKYATKFCYIVHYPGTIC